MNRNFGSPALALILVTSGLPQATREDKGDLLARRFLGHMAANGPVVGTFELRATFDPDLLRKWKADKGRDEPGATVRFGPDEPVHIASWAWDGDREKFENLPGGNTFQTFYRAPGAFLEGMAPDNFNLDRAGRAGAVRPATYYHLCGVVPWSVALVGHKFERRDAPVGAPPGAVALVATAPGSEIRILLDERRGWLLGYEIFEAGRQVSELSIEKLEQGPDGRVFPSRASRTVYEPKSGRPFQLEVLTARAVNFPKTKAELESAFAMSLPKGVRIYDRDRNRKVTLNQPTAVEEILAGRVPFEVMDAAGAKK